MRANQHAPSPAQALDDHGKTEAYYQMFNRTLAAMVEESATTILDVGCATGVLGEHLKSQKPREVWGIEIVPHAAEQAKARLDRVIEGNIEQILPLPGVGEHFDAIIFGDVLEHLQNPLTVLQNIRGHLKPGGDLLVCVPNIAHWSVLGELLQGRFPYAEAGILDATHMRFFTPSSFRDLLAEAGYESVQEFSHIMPNDAVSAILGEAAGRLGIDPKVPLSVTPVYQQLYRARRKQASSSRPQLAVVLGNASDGTHKPATMSTLAVVTHNSMDTLPECLEHLRTFMGPNDRLVAVDRGSTDGTSQYLAKIAENEMRLKVIHLDGATGYAAALNRAVENATGDTLFIVDPRAVLFDGWMAQLTDHFTAEKVGMVAPHFDAARGWQNFEKYVPSHTEGDFTNPSYAAHVRLANRGKVREVPAVEPLAVAIPRRVLDKVGRFDDRIEHPLAAMLDYAWRIRREGMVLFCAADVYGHLMGGGDHEEAGFTEGCDVLADSLTQFYGHGNVPPAEALFGSLPFEPRFDPWKLDHENPFAPIAPGDGKALYLDLMKRALTNWVYADHEPHRWNPAKRTVGMDWPPSPWSHTMVGVKRLDNLQLCLEAALRDGVPGDFLEAGAWRGGASIFARALLKAHGVEDRTVWVADSFEGLPKPNEELYPQDAGDRHHTFDFLAVSLDEVKRNFDTYGLLDEGVRFLKGWFKDTLPSAEAEAYAVLRLDGDMYESTMDALNALYPKLSPGGFLIVDDYGAVPACRQAVEDYRAEHGIDEPIIEIDWTGAYWRKAR